ncbi:MAG: chorismate synthase [Paludibacteraceae bacterium]|nr:chorismate synthase [Paludibacteraceae bacterium]
MNTLGEKFSFTSFGESHGKAIGGVLDGVPAGVRIDMDRIREALDKRAGRVAPSLEDGCAYSLELKGKGISPRALREGDEVEWLSGVMDGVTLGTPIAFIIRNKDARPEDYEWLKYSYRIGHADRTYQEKYGIRDHRGGGRASARETASRVVAGTVAQQLLAEKGIEIRAKLMQVGEEKNPERFDEYIAAIQRDGDSIGGIVECVITGLPVGVGEPIFDKLQSHLAFAMMSINGCKGFEYGSGFEGVGLKGSEMYLSENHTLISGGIAGGISDGTPVVFRCVFKPTASNRKTLETMFQGSKVSEFQSFKAGRHDACIAVRAVAVVEAMAALVVRNLM